MGVGEWLFKALLVSLGVIGAFNIGTAFIFMIEKIAKELRPKWAYIYLILTSLGIVALEIIILSKS
jgi:hypothetical protein